MSEKSKGRVGRGAITFTGGKQLWVTGCTGTLPDGDTPAQIKPRDKVSIEEGILYFRVRLPVV